MTYIKGLIALLTLVAALVAVWKDVFSTTMSEENKKILGHIMFVSLAAIFFLSVCQIIIEHVEKKDAEKKQLAKDQLDELTHRAITNIEDIQRTANKSLNNVYEQSEQIGIKINESVSVANQSLQLVSKSYNDALESKIRDDDRQLTIAYESITVEYNSLPIFHGNLTSEEYERRMTQIVQNVLRTLRSQLNNPVLINNTVIYDEWKKFEASMDRLNWALVGYDRPPFNDVTSAITQELLSICRKFGDYYQCKNTFIYNEECAKMYVDMHTPNSNAD